MISHTEKNDIREALDDLVKRGVIEEVFDKEGVKRYSFPDEQTGIRLLKESMAARAIKRAANPTTQKE